jgi:YD repeat-containing protein
VFLTSLGVSTLGTDRKFENSGFVVLRRQRNLLSLNLTDAGSHSTTYTYDNMDRRATRSDALSHSEGYQHLAQKTITASHRDVMWEPC